MGRGGAGVVLLAVTAAVLSGLGWVLLRPVVLRRAADAAVRSRATASVLLGAYVTGTAALAAGPLTGRGDVRLVLAAAALPLLGLTLPLTRRPHVVLAGLVVVTVAHLGAVAAGVGVPGLVKGALLFGVLTAWRGLRRGELRLHTSGVLAALLAFVLIRTVSLLGAPDRMAGLLEIADFVQNAVLLVVVLVLASAPGGLRTLVLSSVGTMTILAGLSVVQEYVLGNGNELGGLSRVPKGADVGGRTGRHSGPYFDANFWGRDLVLFLPLALAGAVAARRRLHRWAAAAAALALLTGIYLTQSRGAYLAVGVALVVYLAAAGGAQRRLLWAAPLVLALLVSLPGVGSRLATVTQVAQAATGGGDASLVGRVAALRLGLAMAQDRPLLGVGAANFLTAQEEYQRRDPTFAQRELAPHSLYLQMAAESGVLGLLAWCAFFGVVVGLALSARHRRSALPRGPSELTLGLLAGLAAWAFASLFLHLAEFHLLVLVVAMVVLVHRQARTAAFVPVPRPSSTVPVLAGCTAVVCFVQALVGIAVTAPLAHREWEVVMYSTVATGDAQANPYEYRVAGRRVISTTYLALLQQRVERADAQQSTSALQADAGATSQLITVTATDADRERAVTSAGRVLAETVTDIERSGVYYVLRPLPEQTRTARTAVVVHPARTAFAVLGASAIGLLAALVVLAAGGRLGRRRRPRAATP